MLNGKGRRALANPDSNQPTTDDDRTVVRGPDAERTVIGQPPVGDATVIGAPPGTALHCLVGREVESAQRPNRVYLLLLVSAGGAPEVRLPTNLCLLLDRSGSMDVQPLEFAKQAANFVVDSLEANDVLSIVSFDDQVEVVMPPRRVVNKELIKQHITRITARGTTNIYDGLSAALEQSGTLAQGGYVSRIVFLTDGAPTTGIKDHSSIVSVAQQARQLGVGVSTLGFGIEYNEELLSGIARAGGGAHFYISRPEMIPEVFRLEIGSVLRVVAKNLRLELHLAKWTQCVQVYGKEAHISERLVSLPLVDLEANSILSILAELAVLPRAPGTYRLTRAVLHFDDLATRTARQLEQPAVVRFTNNDSEVAAELRPEVARELQVAEAARQLQQTMVGLKTMQISSTQALQQLGATRSLLAEQGRQLEATQVDLAISSLQHGAPDAQKSLAETLHRLEMGKQAEGQKSGGRK